MQNVEKVTFIQYSAFTAAVWQQTFLSVKKSYLRTVVNLKYPFRYFQTVDFLENSMEIQQSLGTR